MSTGETEALLTVIYLGMIPAAFLIYTIPSIIAFRRRHPNRFAIPVINIAFGGTRIGWLGALVWALGADHPDRRRGRRAALHGRATLHLCRAPGGHHRAEAICP